jgi:hypothetical protein
MLARTGDSNREFPMRSFLAATALAAAVTFTASAEDFTADTSLADDDRVVRSVSLEDMKAIAVAEGHTITEVGGEGAVSVRATTPDGLIFHLIGRPAIPSIQQTASG